MHASSKSRGTHIGFASLKIEEVQESIALRNTSGQHELRQPPFFPAPPSLFGSAASTVFDAQRERPKRVDPPTVIAACWRCREGRDVP